MGTFCLKQNINKMTFKCYFCDKEYKHKPTMKNHVRAHHIMCSCVKKYIVGDDQCLSWPKTIGDCPKCLALFEKLQCGETHDGIVCMKSFADISSLHGHKKIIKSRGQISNPITVVVSGDSQTLGSSGIMLAECEHPITNPHC